ncbi:MAG: SLAP domain-containing protein [Clostridium sp.]|uniref:SLAP domain-containing protein n=1 Tax=Clostridium sp. TaxID=1506 RepID=UPI003D6CFE06
MKKRYIATIMLAILSLSIVGCDKKEVSPTKNELGVVTQQKPDDQTKKKVEEEAKLKAKAEADQKTPQAAAKPDNQAKKKAEEEAKQKVKAKVDQKTPQVVAKSNPKPTTTTTKKVTKFEDYNNPRFLDNCVNINPEQAYYEGNKFVIIAYVTNGINSNIYNVNVKNITVSNDQGVIASDGFGVMQGATIGTKQFITWKFTFSASSVKMQGADLQYLKTKSGTTYNY